MLISQKLMLISGRFTRTFEHKPTPEGDDKWSKLSIIAVDYLKSKYFTYNDEYIGPTDIFFFFRYTIIFEWVCL